jgi:hypothetical protein
MTEAKPKRRRHRKIPYIGKPLTASEIAAAHPLDPEMEAIVERALAEVRAKRSRRARALTVRSK